MTVYHNFETTKLNGRIYILGEVDVTDIVFDDRQFMEEDETEICLNVSSDGDIWIEHGGMNRDIQYLLSEQEANEIYDEYDRACDQAEQDSIEEARWDAAYGD